MQSGVLQTIREYEKCHIRSEHRPLGENTGNIPKPDLGGFPEVLASVLGFEQLAAGIRSK
jgi:hypothetical protein